MTYANRKPITVSKVGHVVVPGLEVGVGQRPGRQTPSNCWICRKSRSRNRNRMAP